MLSFWAIFFMVIHDRYTAIIIENCFKYKSIISVWVSLSWAICDFGFQMLFWQQSDPSVFPKWIWFFQNTTHSCTDVPLDQSQKVFEKVYDWFIDINAWMCDYSNGDNPYPDYNWKRQVPLSFFDPITNRNSFYGPESGISIRKHHSYDFLLFFV